MCVLTACVIRDAATGPVWLFLIEYDALRHVLVKRLSIRHP